MPYKTREDRLNDLHELYNEGSLTYSQYEALKNRILFELQFMSKKENVSILKEEVKNDSKILKEEVKNDSKILKEEVKNDSSINNTIEEKNQNSSVIKKHNLLLTNINIEMVLIESGKFNMGNYNKKSNDEYKNERPVHEVTLSEFYIGKYSVTQLQWQLIMGSNPSVIKGDYLPVENVSWNDVQIFIIKLNNKTGINFRLPTEAEWEFAAKGGIKSKGFKFAGSNNLDEVGWYSENSLGKIHPVGKKKANELGVFDMSGNVWEWCQDRYGQYESESMTNPTGSLQGDLRILRGGSWSSNNSYCRITFRNSINPNYGSGNYGLRLALIQ